MANPAVQLFGGVPAGAASMPGMVTPNISAAMGTGNTDWGELTAAYNLQQKMKEDRSSGVGAGCGGECGERESGD